jgi:hypothetical protein
MADIASSHCHLHGSRRRLSLTGCDYNRNLRSTKWDPGSSCAVVMVNRQCLLGSLAEVICSVGHVRFAPRIGHHPRNDRGPLWAMCGNGHARPLSVMFTSKKARVCLRSHDAGSVIMRRLPRNHRIPWPRLLMRLAGPEHGRTVPLPDLSQAEIPRCGEP